MFFKRFDLFFILFLPFFLPFSACVQKSHPAGITPSVEETTILLNYLEENGNIVNSPGLPSIINASEVFENLENPGLLVIDIRPKYEYNQGFIPRAINVLPGEILDFFETKIDPNDYELIVLTCPNGSLSGYVNAVLLFLGYENVSTMRFGMSSWSNTVARDYWLSAIGDTLEGSLELTPNPKNAPGPLPAIATGETDGRNILLRQARKILNVSITDVEIGINEVLAKPDKYYLVSYWPEHHYNEGHIPGSIHYQPKKSLYSLQDIRTLPTDRPIVLYCYSGHHTAFVAPFLHLLGYEAYNLSYGANSFTHTTMSHDPSPTRSFSEKSIGNYPVYIGREKID